MVIFECFVTILSEPRFVNGFFNFFIIALAAILKNAILKNVHLISFQEPFYWICHVRISGK